MKKFIAFAALIVLLILAGVSFACPIPAQAVACQQTYAAVQTYAVPLAAYVVPYTPTITMPVQQVQVQAQVQVPQQQIQQQVMVPQVQQQAAVYAAPVQFAAQVYATPAYAQQVVVQRQVLVQKQLVYRAPARVIVQQRGLLGRLADRIRARQAQPRSAAAIIRH